MKCKTPFRKGLGEFGCGRCLPCRINRQRLLTIRGLLEAGQHSHSSYVTLTLDEEHNPDGRSCVSVYEAQLFLKRLREAAGPFRYLLCGEYGERTWRAHYHAILFGLRDGCGVQDAWKKGHVHISGVGPESIAYVAGYCLKGAYNAAGMRWHNKGFLCPEFVTMSLKPGLGAAAADRISAFYVSEQGSALLSEHGDVSPVIRQGQQLWPLGRYLRGRVRQGCGIDAEKLSQVRQLNEAAQALQLDQAALNLLSTKMGDRSLLSGYRAEARQKRKSLERKL